jgi:hypothetical protein
MSARIDAAYANPPDLTESDEIKAAPLADGEQPTVAAPTNGTPAVAPAGHQDVMPPIPAAQMTPPKSSMVLHPLQQAILAALDGQALKKQPLANKVCAGEGTRLYKQNGIKELIKAGLVAHAYGIGYYRPNAPPPGLIVPAEN